MKAVWLGRGRGGKGKVIKFYVRAGCLPQVLMVFDDVETPHRNMVIMLKIYLLEGVG
jgi:hypothetical protein